ncbi:hypothetical protein Taro_013282, partial [Colocasia esculenta]|nr:hypothetical protein [Colocasia esculenta]
PSPEACSDRGGRDEGRRPAGRSPVFLLLLRAVLVVAALLLPPSSPATRAKPLVVVPACAAEHTATPLTVASWPSSRSSPTSRSEFDAPVMDGARRSGDAFPLQSFYIAAVVTVLCCLVALWSSLLRFRVVPKKNAMAVESGRPAKKQCVCSCACGGGDGGEGSSGTAAGHASGDVAAGEQQAGSSMMEQLVPEITMHVLSYLDHVSLCSLSKTSSAMRNAANDDNTWRALYFKDFTVEQDNLAPVNGWKAYYAATKSVVDLNAKFFDAIRNRSLQEMSLIWLVTDYVKCVHGSGELFSGYTSVMDSWELAFDWIQGGQGGEFEIQDLRARVVGEVAWITMTLGSFHVTNIFELCVRKWYMVHHHSSKRSQSVVCMGKCGKSGWGLPRSSALLLGLRGGHGLRSARQHPHPLDERLRVVLLRQDARQLFGAHHELNSPHALHWRSQDLQAPAELGPRFHLGGRRPPRLTVVSHLNRLRCRRSTLLVQGEQVVQPAALELLTAGQGRRDVAHPEHTVPRVAREDVPGLDGGVELRHPAGVRHDADADAGARAMARREHCGGSVRGAAGSARSPAQGAAHHVASRDVAVPHRRRHRLAARDAAMEC